MAALRPDLPYATLLPYLGGGAALRDYEALQAAA